MKICAIDFETANRSMASVCAVGISVMEEGALTDNYYSLIRPEKDLGPFSPMNIAVHGIQGTGDVLDDIKNQGFDYSTKSGITVSVQDAVIP